MEIRDFNTLRDMTITADAFAAYLKCPTKCFLRAHGEAGSGNDYADWVHTESETYRAEGLRRLTAGAYPGDCVTGASAKDSPKTAKWRVTTDVDARTQNLESRIHAVERFPPEGRGKTAQFIPLRFVFTNKLSSDDKLLAAYDALVLSEASGQSVSFAKIIHGGNHAAIKVKAASLRNRATKQTDKIAALLSADNAPDLLLNRHCGECEFQTRCRQKAVEKDDLSLLSGMSEKVRKKIHSRGIFTVTQLSYTFRPRRRPKRLRDKREKYHHALKALAIREKKIHIVGTPKLKIEGTPVYLDVEGLPDRDFYYLIGVRIGNGESAVQHSLWADTAEDEKGIWADFLAILNGIENPVLIHYGRFETQFIKVMAERHGNPPQDSPTAKAFAHPVNLLSNIYGRVYFPTFSNGLKEIARHLGFEWSAQSASGLATVVWRERWQVGRDTTDRASLVRYNAEDCVALEMVTRKVGDLALSNSSNARSSETVVDTTLLKREHPYRFKRNDFVLPELDSINKAAYWDYQRERVYVRTAPVLKHVVAHAKRVTRRLPYNAWTEIPRPRCCPRCFSRKFYQHGKEETRTVVDLKFMRHGIKRWVTCFHFRRYRCEACAKTFYPPEAGWNHIGPELRAYSVYQIIGLHQPQEIVYGNLNKFFDLHLASGTTNRIKATAAETYEDTYQALVKRLAMGQLLHVDETKISVKGSDHVVWILASLTNVVYLSTETREGDFIQTVLKDFKGVLVSDFYAAYDGIECPQQKCLIHLIRDLNDDVFKHPYDDELKVVVKAFADLVKPMIETIDRHGLKTRFLKKHCHHVDTFYRVLLKMNLTSELVLKCRQRLEKNREGLFTFLRYDGVPWNNNNAEHAVKAFAALRRVIKGVTTAKGLRDYLVLLSICQTCKYQGLDFLDFLRSGEKDIEAFAQSRRRGRRTGPGAALRTEQAAPRP